jgi:hypothetical protein
MKTIHLFRSHLNAKTLHPAKYFPNPLFIFPASRPFKFLAFALVRKSVFAYV